MVVVENIKNYVIKPVVIAKAISSKPVYALVIMPVLIAIQALSIETQAAGLLFALFWADFATGIAASYVEFKSGLPPKVKGAPKRYVIESAKLKMSAVKFIIYGTTLLIAKGIQYVFVPATFKLHDNVNTMTITVMVAGFLCAIEIYSIVFENFKRMGWDIIQLVKKMFTKYKSVKKQLTK